MNEFLVNRRLGTDSRTNRQTDRRTDRRGATIYETYGRRHNKLTNAKRCWQRWQRHL